MSYDIYLTDPVSGDTLELDAPHQLRGGTYCQGGTTAAHLNITWNYGVHFYRLFPERDWREGDDEHYKGQPIGGIRTLYGTRVSDSLQLIAKAISQLGDDVDPDYWKATEGNAKRALLDLLSLGAMVIADGHFSAVWRGD